MTIVVEDGTGKPDANSYVSLAGLKAYADARGLAYGTDDNAIQAALIRATAWLDATYRARFPGVRSNAGQALQWPRRAGHYEYGVYVTDRYSTTVYDAEGVPIAVNSVPQVLVNAECEAAVREIASPGGLAPDLDRGGAITRLQAGSVEIEYSGNAPAGTTYQAIDAVLSSILTGGSESSSFSARAVRA